ncbi:MAG: DUF2339 domain-containing protein [Ilyomonas sp.]
MDQSNDIKALKERLEQLSKQVADQQKQIASLEQKMNENKLAQPLYSVSKRTNKTATPSFELENFIGLRLIHLVGIVVLVIGLAIGVKYAIDQNLISPFTRIALAYAAGGLLYILSLYLRNKYEAFSAILFSGSMASFYFTTYAATVYYNILPGWMAFVAMILLTIYTAYTSVQYNRQEIAVLGMVGAYGIPFLISKNTDASLLFFCYILLINTGIVFLAFKRLWQTLKWLSFFITWFIFIGWTFVRYHSSEQFTAVVFMSLFWLLFMLSAVISYNKTKKLNGADRSIIVLNNVAVYIASLVLFNVDFNKSTGADVTGIFALLCFILSYATGKIFLAETKLPRYLALEAITALIIFAALQFKGISITFIWLSIAVVLFVTGMYSNKSWPRLASIATFALTLLKLLLFDSLKFSTIQKIISYIIIGSLLLIVSFFYQKFKLAFFPKKDDDGSE